MTRIVVELDRLSEFVDRMDAVAAQLRLACAEADARIRHLRDAWTGSASAAQAAAHAQWRGGAAEVHDALASLRCIVATAHENYAAAAFANRRMWSI
jgi:WXG100 family type VII secretion target